MKFTTVATLLSFGSAAVAAPAPASSDAAEMLDKRQSLSTKMVKTDTYMWSTTLSNFIRYRNSKNPSWLIWTSDGCTSSPDKPFGWNFVLGCYRHDFGYRNYKNQDRFTSGMKLNTDNRFKADLYWVCDTQASSATRGTCKTLANTYYTAVRKLAKRQLEGDDDINEEDNTETLPEIAEEIARIQSEFDAHGYRPEDLVVMTSDQMDAVIGGGGFDEQPEPEM